MAMAAPAPRVLADFASRTAITQIALVLGGAAFVGVAAQIAIPLPFTPVPLTLQTFAVLLVGASLGSLRGALSMVVYLIVGMVGVPWFAEGSSGFSNASFGYILGFIFAAFIVGRLAERGASTTALRSAGLMVVGNLAIYAVGVTWLKFAIDVNWATALSLGVVPFLIGDAVKIALAAGLLPLSWKGLEKLQLRNS
jgi:biotin transport system substrate-specific component